MTKVWWFETNHLPLHIDKRKERINDMRTSIASILNRLDSAVSGTEMDNDSEVKPKYDRTIDSINGDIGIKHCYDTEYGVYNAVYLNDTYVCDTDMECTDKEIEDLVEAVLFKADII